MSNNISSFYLFLLLFVLDAVRETYCHSGILYFIIETAFLSQFYALQEKERKEIAQFNPSHVKNIYVIDGIGI